jgi:dienelactone hydrolase
MTRRDLLVGAGAAMALPAVLAAQQLPGTAPLTWTDDLADRMMDGAHLFAERKIAEAAQARARYWKRDLSSRGAYEKSVAANRERFRAIIGLADAREPAAMERFALDNDPLTVADAITYRVWQVRWPVFGDVAGEGLLLEPAGAPAGHVVALADADQTPEQIAGLAPGVAPASQFARRLAENGFMVAIPALVDRGTRWSGNPAIRMTDQQHREWIYRQAYHMGRHVIGYEVQKVLAAVDWFARTRAAGAKIGVAGYAEGGLIAFYAAAADPRIDAALVSGYFESREHVWSEPIYRNVWSLLREFGDAEIASLIAPRGLTVEHCAAPEISSPRGDLKSPALASVQAEFARIDSLVAPGFQPRALVQGGPGSPEAIASFGAHLGGRADRPLASLHPTDSRRAFRPDDRQKRQVQGMEKHVQSLVRGSDNVREQFFLLKVMPELKDETWNTQRRVPMLSAEKFIEGAKPYRRIFREEILGRFDEPVLPPNARTRRVYDNPKWTGYDVVLDVWPEVFAWGIMLVPKDIKPGERRPVVVCQHGRNGLPKDSVEGDSAFYRDYAARLANEGFVTFSPHNLYRGEDRYRWLCRKANNVKATLFSFIIEQHAQILRWLASLPMVDGKRIGFYGLSYGGETAVRVPTVLDGYAASVCSGDFNTWTEKVSSTDLRFGYMYTIEWEMPYFNMGSTFDYAEMAYLMIPRPFFVERGHSDRVSQDQWVAYQYAKVRRLYDQLGLADRTEIQFFNGGHTINGEGSFEFLRKYLKA